MFYLLLGTGGGLVLTVRDMQRWLHDSLSAPHVKGCLATILRQGH